MTTVNTIGIPCHVLPACVLDIVQILLTFQSINLKEKLISSLMLLVAVNDISTRFCISENK